MCLYDQEIADRGRKFHIGKGWGCCILDDVDVPGSVAGGKQGNPEVGTWNLTVGRADYFTRIVAGRYELFNYDNIATHFFKPGAP
jgi:hypothetical protein